MANTYTQIFIQIVFAVKNRNALIKSSWETELYKYITGIVQNKKHKLIAINGMPDHIHIFIGMKPDMALSDLVREIKKSTNAFIKEKQFCPFHFEWQEGFGAFSYAQSDIPNVARYIENQKTHHQKETFKTEYLQLLQEFEIEYKPEYLFDWLTETE